LGTSSASLIGGNAPNSTTVTYGGPYYIQGQDSLLWVEVIQSRTDNSAPLAINTQTLQPNQQFLLEPNGSGFYKIKNVASGKYLDTRATPTSTLAAIQQWDGDPTSIAQLWQMNLVSETIKDVFYILNKSTQKVCDVCGSGKTAGTPVINYQLNPSINQQFKLVRVDGNPITYQPGLLSSSLNMSSSKTTTTTPPKTSTM